MGWFSDFFDSVGDAASGIVNGVGDAVSGVVEGIGDVVSDIGRPLLQIAQFIPPLAPYAMAINAALALKEGNPVGALLSVAGMPGVGGPVSSALGMTQSAFNTARNVVGGLNAASHGDPLGVAMNGMGALSSYNAASPMGGDAISYGENPLGTLSSNEIGSLAGNAGAFNAYQQAGMVPATMGMNSLGSVMSGAGRVSAPSEMQGALGKVGQAVSAGAKLDRMLNPEPIHMGAPPPPSLVQEQLRPQQQQQRRPAQEMGRPYGSTNTFGQRPYGSNMANSIRMARGGLAQLGGR